MNEIALHFIMDIIISAIGAFIGFLLALFMQAHVDKKSRAKKISLFISNVNEEIVDISTSLQQYVIQKKPLDHSIPTPCWDAVLGSGIILELIEAPYYAYTIRVYSLINSFNEERLNLDRAGNIHCLEVIIENSVFITNIAFHS